MFTRKGNDIHAELPISLPEAVLGARIEVPTVAGNVTLTVPKGANTGTRLRIKGKGGVAPGGRNRGDHYVTFKVVLPDKPDPESEVGQIPPVGDRHIFLTGTAQPPLPLQLFLPAHPLSPDLQPPRPLQSFWPLQACLASSEAQPLASRPRNRGAFESGQGFQKTFSS